VPRTGNEEDGVPLLAVAFIAAVMLVSGTFSVRAATNEDAVAVVIGNSNYTAGRIPKVDYAHRDAAAFRRYLIDVLGYREGNIIDLRDATQAQMEAALGNDRTHEGSLWQYIRPEGSDVTVFYSGHGVPGLKSKRGYLLPVNADPNKPEINGYPVDTLYANLAKLPARSVTVYLDACFSGDSPKGMLINATSGITVTPRLPKQKNKLTILTAATGDQVASWDLENRHGLFTEHLLAALYGAADASRYGAADGKVTLGEVKKYLARNMSYAAKRTYGRIQRATINGSEGVVLAALGANHPKRPVLATGAKRVASLPPPTVQVEEMDASYQVLKRANVRSGPGTSFAKARQLSPGVVVDVTGKVRDKDWYRVGLADGGQGYVWGKLLSERRPAPKPSGGKKIAVGIYPKGLQPGDVFKDCDDCPEMVVIPMGSFKMGIRPTEREWYIKQGGKKEGSDRETPLHSVKISYELAVGKFELTRGQYSKFVVDTGRGSGDGCLVIDLPNVEWKKAASRNWRSPGFEQTDDHPVACVSWDDAKAYVDWLSRKTREPYRLLSEAEWEYAARAGTWTMRYWGDDWYNKDGCAYANLIDKGNWKTASGFDCADSYGFTAPVGMFRANSFGLHDMHGNVSEWTEDCWNKTYHGAPNDGRPWVSGDCSRRVMRGGFFVVSSFAIRAANRAWHFSGSDANNNGFRIARPLLPGQSAERTKQSEVINWKRVAAIIPPKVATPKLANPALGVYPKRRLPGDTFKDCNNCPEMVVIPPGRFRMGDLSGEGNADENPVHNVHINYSFAVGKFEVTQAQWTAVMGNIPSPFNGDNHPVERVGWNMAKAYIARLSKKAGQRYRLLSEAEWEYVVRADTKTKYAWGDSFDATKANNASSAKKVGSYSPNAFGLHDLHGNATEWVEDCWHPTYEGAPADGSAWTSGGDCKRRVLRGGSYSGVYFAPSRAHQRSKTLQLRLDPKTGQALTTKRFWERQKQRPHPLRTLRAAYRSGILTGGGGYGVGFRIARTLSHK
jgi:formylglycine-generating enzyme required for sulfatase activity